MNPRGINSKRWRKKLLTTALILFSLGSIPASRADELQLVWQLAPGDREYLTTGNTERGVAINPATGHVLVVSRFDNQIHILDGETGDDLGVLTGGDTVSGGLFPINMIGVAEDGAIYVGNLSTNPTTPEFKLYRWENETSEGPTTAFDGDPSGLNDEGASNNPQRWGDSIDVRGSGVDTQVLIGSNAGTVAALLTTTNGTDFASIILTEAATSGAVSVAFGSGNTFWTKKNGASLRQVQFDPGTGIGTVLRTATATEIPNTAAPIAVNAASNWLAAITIETPDTIRLYDISSPTTIALSDQEALVADNANANGVGSADFADDLLAALDTNNGLSVYRIVKSESAPEFTLQPPSATILEGGFGSISVSVTGTTPITFQWQLDGTNLPGATDQTLSFTNISLANAGSYTVVASNSVGVTTSEPGLLTVEPVLHSERASVLWRLLPGERTYLTGDGNSERGIAYNQVTGHVLVVSRTGATDIHVLNGDAGADLWSLQAPTDIVQGSVPAGFRLNMIAVADDGAVYAANLDTSGGTYAIYRWEDDTTNSIPTVAWGGAPVDGRRWGDTLAARGSGIDTQLIAASNVPASEENNVVAVFTTGDGLNFTANPITIEGVNDDAFRLGIAFGASNTFWGKATTFPLQQVSYDLGTGTGTVIGSFTNIPSSGAGIAVNAESNLVAVLTLETPDSVRLYDVSNASADPVLVDQELFSIDNANGNGTASADFGNDRLYVLDTNNGILALKLNSGGTETEAPLLSASSVSGGTFSFTLTGVAGATYKIRSTADFVTWQDVKDVTAGADGKVTVTDSAGDAHRFYRAQTQ